MQGYDGTQKFYSPDINQNMQLMEYGKLPDNQIDPTKDTGSTYIDQENNQVYEVIGDDSNGNTIFKRYKLVDLKQLLQIPELQDIEGVDGNQIRLDPLTQELIGPSMFHASDYNINTIETVINILLKNQAIQGQNETAIIDFFKQLTDDQLAELSTSISQIIDERYYTKSDVDEKINNLQKQIDNLSNAVNYKPQPNSVFPPGFTGEKDIDINDTIHDQNIEDKVEALNDIDEKGE
ncbi:hypothetical protein [Companilactobacillus nodensis]|uniref:Uncharacterized protein n=1 Tax=Companilactobacillus nodensis DSM 19682 = JCM 14932 = NBRC 107160 TaxID=1423775 RepID=A0A0R1KAL4_9LACO|nr:hypothetical protein [Companilactobacillus nodensis]KRK80376.1 hypothetical protein FD03_GL001795 [Companilactobacillus nodensis DSM 19682 = JCM 14932 = NBRC 107160]